MLTKLSLHRYNSPRVSNIGCVYSVIDYHDHAGAGARALLDGLLVLLHEVVFGRLEAQFQGDLWVLREGFLLCYIYVEVIS